MVGPTASTPKISSITYAPTTTGANTSGGETITLTGAGFNSGCTVFVDNISCTTTYVSNNSVTFTSPVKAVGAYHVYVYNIDGSVAMKPNGITFITYIPSTIEYLVVAGGGAGGYERGGGGGAGGLLTATGYAISNGTYTVTVGAGATALGTYGPPPRGNDSVFGTITAKGGGGGISADTAAGTTQTGGSGGGGAGSIRTAGGAGVYPGSTYLDQVRQGYDGGTATYSAPYYGAGGGGGSTSVGGNGTSSVAGNGGTGTTSSISGSSVNYAGGGGGGTYGGGTAGTASFGGGGGGATVIGTPGTDNTGGGGGGGGALSKAGGNGGSGVVIIRYSDAFPLATSSANVAAGYPTTSGGYRIYRWITSGTITF
jgi:hypothetical protein